MYRIRKMTRKDLKDVMVIERMSFASPWNESGFAAELDKNYSINWVAEMNFQIAGYMIAWKIDDEIHIANLAVAENCKRKGVATLFFRKLEYEHDDVRWMGLEVRSSNVEAQTLYKKLGFHEAGIRKNYYIDEGEDAVLMIKKFSTVIL